MDEHEFQVSFAGTAYPAYYIKTKENANIVLNKLMGRECLFGIDTETMALPKYKGVDDAPLNPHLSRIRLLQLFTGEVSFVFDMLTINCDDIFVPFLQGHRFLAHNAVFDLQFFKRIGVKDMNIGCTYILSKLLQQAVYPTDEGLSASLANMVQTVFKTDMLKKEQVSDWAVPDLNFSQIEYAAIDPIACLKLGEKLSPGLSKFGLQRIYDLTKRAQHPIAELQLNGILLDIDSHRKLIPTWRDSLYSSKKSLHELTKLDRFTSTTIANYIEQHLSGSELAIWPRTDSGKLSTDSHTLADFSYLLVVAPFSEYQKKEKLLSTYGEGLIQEINPETGRLHARYNLCGARTGRLSSAHPNLQNLPRDSDIRKNFISPVSATFICADYSQIEIRVGAELSRDPVMLNAYRDGIDLHYLTASKVSGKKLEEVTKEDRQLAKALNFGLMFGLGAKKFAKYANQGYEGVDISENEAYQAVSEWHDLYAGYTDWQRERASEASESFVCTTPCGKLRRLPEDKTYGAAMNQPVQGGAAEVMLYALCFLHDCFKNTQIKLVNTVHDEILVEMPDCELVPEVAATIKGQMTEAYKTVFPDGITKNLVSIGVGQNWGKAK